MIDSRNNKLEIGQKVIYTYTNSQCLYTGVITGFTQKMVRVEYTSDMIVLKHPSNLLILK